MHIDQNVLHAPLNHIRPRRNVTNRNAGNRRVPGSPPLLLLQTGWRSVPGPPLLGNKHGGAQGDMLTEQIWLPTPIQAHPLFMTFLDRGCPRSMFQALRAYNNANRPERASRTSEPYPPTSAWQPQERWHSSGSWQTSAPADAAWAEGSTWAPAPRTRDRGNPRTWSSNRARSSKDDFDEL